jgi:hypothetical protein
MRRIKAYYTADEIINGLYTLGGEYMLNDNTEYVGPYHRYTTTNEVYTQSEWDIRKSVQLFKFQDLPKNVKSYKRIKTTTVSRNIPTFAPITISSEDIANGYIIRYFCKKRNEDVVFETNSEQWQQWQQGQLDQVLWDIVPVQWKITGPLENTTQNKITTLGVINYNRDQIIKAQQVLPTILHYVTNFSEYYTDSDFTTPKDINGLDS